MTNLWVLADVGGTNTRVGVSSAQDRGIKALQSFRNSEYPGFAELLADYIKETKIGTPRAICAGVAGPVRNGNAQLTNRDWFIDSTALSATTGARRVALLNDLQAQGYALNDLNPSLVSPISYGTVADSKATRMVIGLGTGSNVAVVHDTPDGLFVPPAESGHASLPYASGELAKLIEHLGSIHPHRPMEAALSGPGLTNIHHWVSGDTLAPEEIISAYLEGDAAASTSLGHFVHLLGQVVGDLSLAHLPMGGVYFIGGLARAVAPHLQTLGFRDAFCAKGPYTPILQDIPLSLIRDDNAAVLGCSRYLRQGSAR